MTYTLMLLLWPVALTVGVAISLRHLHSTPRGMLTWEAVPSLVSLFSFVLIGCINWDYEHKLLVSLTSARLSFSEANLGPILLLSALGMALIAGALLYVLRVLASRLFGPRRAWGYWIPTVAVILLVTVFTVASNAIVILGPAAITMSEQMRTVPGQ
jgi:hypothetical protein